MLSFVRLKDWRSLVLACFAECYYQVSSLVTGSCKQPNHSTSFFIIHDFFLFSYHFQFQTQQAGWFDPLCLEVTLIQIIRSPGFVRGSVMGQVVTKQVLSPQSSGDHLPHGQPIRAPWSPHHRAPAPHTHGIRVRWGLSLDDELIESVCLEIICLNYVVIGKWDIRRFNLTEEERFLSH